MVARLLPGRQLLPRDPQSADPRRIEILSGRVETLTSAALGPDVNVCQRPDLVELIDRDRRLEISILIHVHERLEHVVAPDQRN